MKRALQLLALLAVAASANMPGPAFAQSECVRLLDGRTACPPADTRCVKDRYGDWLCSGPGGDAVININGNPVCGVGACVKDVNGEFQCSTQPRGAAAMDVSSKPVCSGGCETASASRCTKLVP
jgi:hypothetical protein